MSHINETAEYLAVSDWLTSLGVMCSEFIRVVGVSVLHSFVRLSNTPRGMRLPRGVSPFSRRGNSGCFHLLAIADNAALNIGVQYLFESLLSILLGTYPEEKFLDPLVILCFVF